MPLVSVQCPNCGAPLHCEGGREHWYCGYCGARLRLAGSEPGLPVPQLEAIRADTGLLAYEAAFRHLERRVAALNQERQRARRRLDALTGKRRYLADRFGSPLLAERRRQSGPRAWLRRALGKHERLAIEERYQQRLRELAAEMQDVQRAADKLERELGDARAKLAAVERELARMIGGVARRER